MSIRTVQLHARRIPPRPVMTYTEWEALHHEYGGPSNANDSDLGDNNGDSDSMGEGMEGVETTGEQGQNPGNSVSCRTFFCMYIHT